jgi:glycosyltransferase involved in cell wall biosynthesis
LHIRAVNVLVFGPQMRPKGREVAGSVDRSPIEVASSFWTYCLSPVNPGSGECVKRIKVVALVEANVVTGPAKNILRFAADCRNQVDLTVVTFVRSRDTKSDEESNNQFVLAVRSLGVPIETVRETGRFDFSVLDGLRRNCQHHRPDIVQTHGIKSHFLVSLLPRMSFRWLAFHHGYTSEDLKMWVYCQVDRWSLRRCDFVVTVCAEFANSLQSRGVRQDRIFVVPNSVRTDSSEATSADEIRRRFKISCDTLVVLAVGRLSPEKGHRYLIDAVSRIISESPDIKLLVLIAGSGPAEKTLKRDVQRRGLDQRVKLVGYCPNVGALFSIADLFVLPSLSEGSPNVLLESMAARVPIVATNVGGVPELVNDGQSAILVPPGDARSLAKSMLELLVDRSRATQLAGGAFDRARLLFDPAKYDERILNIYAKLIDSRSG